MSLQCFSIDNISDKVNKFWKFVSVRINKVLLYWVHIFYKGFSSFTFLVKINFTKWCIFGHNFVDFGVKFEISVQNPKIVQLSRYFYMSNINFLYRLCSTIYIYILGMLRLDCKTKTVQMLIYIHIAHTLIAYIKNVYLDGNTNTCANSVLPTLDNIG